MAVELNTSAKFTETALPQWGAFSYPAFTIIWLASLVSNTGNAMFDTSSAWLMTSLDADPMAVSLVQVATILPVVLFTLPAGALADVFDSRRLLILAEVAIVVVIAVFATLVSLNIATPVSLLLTTFALSAGMSLSAPAWLSITPRLVNGPELLGAIAANGIGYNVSRAIGPALGGLVIGGFGIAAPIWIDFVGCLLMIVALLWWRSSPRLIETTPPKRLADAVLTGLRHTADNPHLRATMMRSVAFVPFASASWTLLPLVARSQMTQGPACYGALVSTIGAGAIGGSLVLGWLKAKLGSDGTVALGTFGAAVALILFGIAHTPIVALCASILAGASWAAALGSLHASAQFAVPNWVRARGLAVFLTVFFAAMAAGSVLWGRIASFEGVPTAYFAAAAGAILALPMTWRWKLMTPGAGELELGVDIRPATTSQLS